MARNEIHDGNNLNPDPNKGSIPKDSDNTRYVDDDNNLNLNLNKDNIPPKDPDNARLVLVFIAGGLATLSFVGYIITGNINVLPVIMYLPIR